jgi:hypothetical protein
MPTPPAAPVIRMRSPALSCPRIVSATTTVAKIDVAAAALAMSTPFGSGNMRSRRAIE